MELIFFSPTQTTKTIVEAVARGLGAAPASMVDLTYDRTADQPQPSDIAGPTVIGMPVYAGRLPELAVERLRRHVRGQGRPAVLVVVYGNRAFEDALLELKNLAEELGFVPVAGAAFIGEHSFSTSQWPVAPGRPDTADTNVALDFGARVRDKLATTADIGTMPGLRVPGNFPYRDGMPAANIAPETEAETCTLCGTCVEACPTSAITLTESDVRTDPALCLRCCACIRVCPVGARLMPQKVMESAQKLHNLCGQRKEPEMYI
ncbi:MAG: 4Fe-4S dicluster domain-containing protein [Deltaproteobacteria bacterium]|nr:4Fe-4S dicluster domain-containing protein [Deltaproteobacteria bacterium]